MCRKRLGQNAKQAAKRLGVTATTVLFWEREIVVPTVATESSLWFFTLSDSRHKQTRVI